VILELLTSHQESPTKIIVAQNVPRSTNTDNDRETRKY